MQRSNKKGQWEPTMLVEANLVPTRLKQAGINSSGFQEQMNLENNVYFIQKNYKSLSWYLYRETDTKSKREGFIRKKK